MKDDFIICIPTYKRAKILLSDKRNPLDFMNDYLLSKTYLCIREEELIPYSDVIVKYRIKFIIIDKNKPVQALSQTRNNLLQIIIKRKIKKLILMDDDTTFRYRPFMDSKLLERDKLIFTDKNKIKRYLQSKMIFQEMFNKMLGYCSEKYPLIGIRAQGFAGKYLRRWDLNQRIVEIQCIYMPVIKKEKIIFSSEVEGFEDYYFTLKLLTLGYKNVCLNNYVRDSKMNTPGGCSEYRTAKDNNKCALKLAKLFPDYVTAYAKQNGSWGVNRISVRVKWIQAFNEELYNARQI